MGNSTPQIPQDYSQELLQCIEEGNEARAMKYIVMHIDSTKHVAIFGSMCDKKLYTLLEVSMRRLSPGPEVLKRCTDEKCMTIMVGSGRYPFHTFSTRLFANPVMIMTFINLFVNRRPEFVQRFNYNDAGLIDGCIPMFENFTDDELTRAMPGPRRTYLGRVLSEISDGRRDVKTRIIINSIRDKSLNSRVRIGDYDINYRLIHEGESLLMIALTNGYVDLASDLIPKVDLNHECKGRNAMHYAKQHPHLIILMLSQRFHPVWDLDYVSRDLELTRRFLKSYTFKREDYLKIFVRMAQLPGVDDDELRTFFESIQKYVAKCDIPDLLKILDKFPLTYDRLHEIIRPTALEAEVASLKTLLKSLQAPALDPPPAYS